MNWKTIALSLCLLLGTSRLGIANSFDYYINPVLAKVPAAKQAKEIKKITPLEIAEYASVLKGTTAACLIVKTNENRWSKLLVHAAGQKIKDDKAVPILLIERFVTYKEGTERAVQVEGKNIRVFGGFQFNLDFGQVVPKAVGGDLKFVVDDQGKAYAEPVGNAKFYLLTDPIPGIAPEKTEKFKLGKKFYPYYFNGVYKLKSDGRRGGKLHLKLKNDGTVTGHFYSGKDGSKYEVAGNLASPNHKINFRIIYPRTIEFFEGYMFTGDGSAITGTSRMERRVTGFYALRVAE